MSFSLPRLFDLLFKRDTRPKYRELDRLKRKADTRCADPLGTVLNQLAKNLLDWSPARQLADDLSGCYGSVSVQWERKNKDGPGIDDVVGDGSIYIEGRILDDHGRQIGICAQTYYRDGRFLIVENNLLRLDEAAQRRGIGTALYTALEAYYRRSGVDVIDIVAVEVGGYLWAKRGYDWDPALLHKSFTNVRGRIEILLKDPGTAPEDKKLLLRICDRLNEKDPGEGWPTPKELALLRGVDDQLGRKLMKDCEWYGILPLSAKGRRYGT